MCLKKLNLSILHWVCHLVNHLKKIMLKILRSCKRDFDYGSNHEFYKFYKGYDEFEEMSLDSKYNRIKEFNKLYIKFKVLKPKKNRNTTQKRANYKKC